MPHIHLFFFILLTTTKKKIHFSDVYNNITNIHTHTLVSDMKLFDVNIILKGRQETGERLYIKAKMKKNKF